MTWVSFDKIQPVILKKVQAVTNHCNGDTTSTKPLVIEDLSEDELWLAKTIIAESGADTCDMWRVGQVIVNRLTSTEPLYLHYRTVFDVVTAPGQFSCAPQYRNGVQIKKASRQYKLKNGVYLSQKAMSIARSVLLRRVPEHLYLDASVVYFFNREIATNKRFTNAFDRQEAVAVSSNKHEYHNY